MSGPPLLERLTTLAGLEARYPGPDGPLFPASTIRGWIARDVDGIGRCVVQVGRQLLVDLEAFAAWLETRRGRPTRARRPPAVRKLGESTTPHHAPRESFEELVAASGWQRPGRRAGG